MLVSAAEKAGIAVPNDPKDFDAEEFPHFHIYCNVQLGASLPYPTAHWHNAEVVASVPTSEIMKVTLIDLIKLGLSIST